MVATLAIGAGGCGIEKKLDQDFDDLFYNFGPASKAFYAAASRWPRSPAELADGARLAGVRLDVGPYDALTFDPTPDGGAIFHWAEGDTLGCQFSGPNVASSRPSGEPATDRINCSP